MQKVPRVTLGKEICNHDLHKCWVIYLSYNNYTGRIYAKVKMRVNSIICSINCIEYLYLAHVCEGKFLSSAKTCKSFICTLLHDYVMLSFL